MREDRVTSPWLGRGQDTLNEFPYFFGRKAGFRFSRCLSSKCAERSVVGRIGKFSDYSRRPIPDCGDHGTGFDQNDLDTKKHQFASQAIRISLQPKFGSGISAGKWHCQSPADRTDVNDPPRFANATRFRSEQGSECLRDGWNAQTIDLNLQA